MGKIRKKYFKYSIPILWLFFNLFFISIYTDLYVSVPKKNFIELKSTYILYCFTDNFVIEKWEDSFTKCQKEFEEFRYE